jgi:hypothetical protein
MTSRVVKSVLIGLIGVLIVVSVFRNGVDFGKWLRESVDSAESAEAAEVD